jgi:hypothetical protein
MRGLWVGALCALVGCSKKARDDAPKPAPTPVRTDAAAPMTPADAAMSPADAATSADAAIPHVGPFPAGSGKPMLRTCDKRDPGQIQPGRGGTCSRDADCKDGREGRCNAIASGHGRVAPMNRCTYSSCAKDADCKDGPCECEGLRGNHCLAGNCKSDADCPGSVCGRSNFVGCWGGDASYFCRTPQDTCVTYDDCNKPGQSGRGGQCVFLPEVGHFGCKEYPRCPVG